MNRLVLGIVLLTSTASFAQNTNYQNTAANILSSNEALSVRGYAEMVYGQPYSATHRYNGKLDAKRFVLFTGYKFEPSTSFVAEMEVEHGNEIYLEQAFIQHRLSSSVNLRAGVLLIPMGIVNEYHEPTTFHGVERPNVDKYIIPSTWRELGVGFQGVLPSSSMRYQLYVVNGLKSHDGTQGLMDEVNGVRSGRQKAIKSTASHANLTGKLEYVGFANWNISTSFYTGNTQSPLYHGVERSNAHDMGVADSSVINMNMIGLDSRYQKGRIQFRSQIVYNALGNTDAYNAFTGKALGSAMYGGFGELAYQVLPKSTSHDLYVFSRIEQYDTQVGAPESVANLMSDRTEITTGLSWMPSNGTVFKADYQHLNQGGSVKHLFNFGFGVWF